MSLFIEERGLFSKLLKYILEYGGRSRRRRRHVLLFHEVLRYCIFRVCSTDVYDE